uniref:Uncharacterized protein n=1 Tax=Meloidogyne javanica TaxID=6303 RepID=A0A915NCB9_MELJA
MLFLPYNLVCYALILAQLFVKTVAHNKFPLVATIKQNLFYAVVPGNEYPQTRYKFNEADGFEDWRIEQLVGIAEIDNTGMPRGSTQSNDVLMYDEWIYLQNTENFGELYGVFDNAVTSLLNKIGEFKNRNNLINDKSSKPEKVKKSLKRADGNRPNSLKKLFGCIRPSSNDEHYLSGGHSPSPNHSKPQNEQNEELVNLVIECKVFIRDLHSEGAEGSLIDIFSFMNNHSEMRDLKKISELSKIQTEKLDEAIFKRIYEEHKEKSKSKRALVQGAGPVEGVNVTLVDDRSENYIQNRVVFFDRKWMSQLRFFLGTEFDKLFHKNKNGEKSLGSLLDEDIGFVNIRNMETALKERLKILSVYINEQEEERITQEIQQEIHADQQGNQKEKSFLNLIYNTAVLDIDRQYEKPLAILGAPVKRPESFNFNHLWQILTNYEGMIELNETIGIPFDLFFCAGGSQDKIRTRFIEKPKQLTESINYGVAIFDKVNDNVNVFEENTHFFRHHMECMIRHLENQKIDELIRGADFVSEELKKRYANINDLIIHGMGEPEVKRLDSPLTKTSKVVNIRLFELNQSLRITSITPIALVEFIEELKMERNKEGNRMNQKKYDEFLEELQKKWAKALFYYTFSARHPKRFGEVVIEDDWKKQGEASTSTRKIREPKQILKFDPYRENTSTFWVAIYGIENPVKEISGTKDSAIIAAIGDANTSTHFMTSSGTSTGKFLYFETFYGRFGVERAVDAIKKYYQNPDQLNLRKLMNSALKKVRKRVLEKAKEYVDLQPGIKVDIDDQQSEEEELE